MSYSLICCALWLVPGHFFKEKNCTEVQEVVSTFSQLSQIVHFRREHPTGPRHSPGGESPPAQQWTSVARPSPTQTTLGYMRSCGPSVQLASVKQRSRTLLKASSLWSGLQQEPSSCQQHGAALSPGTQTLPTSVFCSSLPSELSVGLQLIWLACSQHTEHISKNRLRILKKLKTDRKSGPEPTHCMLPRSAVHSC